MIQQGMSMIPIEVRERVVKAYRDGTSGTYAETARIFGVGEASVSGWLRKDRDGESLEPRWNGGPNDSLIWSGSSNTFKTIQTLGLPTESTLGSPEMAVV